MPEPIVELTVALCPPPFAREAISKVANILTRGQELVAKGFRLIGDDRMADAIEKYAARVREVTKVEGTFAGRTAESRAEMEKNIKVIDLDTDRRSTAALSRTMLSEATRAADVATAKATAQTVEATKQQVAAYKDLIRTLEDRVAATAREVEELSALTVAEEALIDLEREIADGKLKLTKAQKDRAVSLINEAGANDVLIKSNKEWADLQGILANNAKDLASDRMSLIDSARQEAEQNELLVQTFGMTEDAIIRLNASRLIEQETQRLGRELNAEEVEDLQRVIELKERSAKAVANRAELEQTKQFWTDIEKTAHDTFVSITDGGKNAFQRLKDTAKNTFFDWLYQQTLKKWIVNIQAETSTTGGGNPMEAIFGKSSSFANNATLKSIGQTIGGYMVGSSLNKSISNGYETGSGFMKAEKLATAVGSYVSPVLGAVVGAVSGLVNRAFGRRAKEFADTSTLVGNLGASGFNGTLNTAWKQKGGWFRSDKSGVDKAAVDAMTAAGLTAAYEAIKMASTDYAKILGINADSIAKRAQAINITLGKDQAANEKAIAEFFVGVGDTIALELLPTISQFQAEGESASVTLERVAKNFAGVDAILEAMGVDSQTAFRALGVASIEARERLVSLAGGIESLASQTAFFNQNFLTQAEQIAIISGPLNKELERLGYAGITTTEQFKQAIQGLVQSGALATEAGAQTYAGLLAIAPQFKTVADYLKELSDAAAETAKNAKDAADALAAQALADNETMLRAAVDSAFDVVGRAVDAQRSKLTTAFDQVMDRLGTSIDSLKGRASELTRLSDALTNARGTVSSDAQQIASRGAARAQIQAAIAIAKSSGVLPSADSLKDALSALTVDASDQFSSLADYQREVAGTNAELDALGGMTERQLTDAQKQIALLESQKAMAEIQYQGEMERLDGILEWAQAEVDAINGVDRSVQSVVAAIAGLKVASAALQQGARPSNPTGRNLSVEDLYKTVLGREGEAAGIEFWKKAFGDVVDADEYKQFIKGAQPELEMLDRQNRQAAAANMSGTMSSTLASNNTGEMAEMKSSMARTAAAVEQLATQFNQVSGGGNSLLTEPA